MENQRYYTVNEIAKILRTTRQVVAKYIQSGKLKAYKVTRQYLISEEELQRFMEEECKIK